MKINGELLTIFQGSVGCGLRMQTDMTKKMDASVEAKLLFEFLCAILTNVFLFKRKGFIVFLEFVELYQTKRL